MQAEVAPLVLLTTFLVQVQVYATQQVLGITFLVVLLVCATQQVIIITFSETVPVLVIPLAYATSLLVYVPELVVLSEIVIYS